MTFLRWTFSLSIMVLGLTQPLITVAESAAPQLYAGRCVACHGQAGAGNEALGAPSIAGISAGYLTLQLRHYRDGIRGGADGDSPGHLMAASAQGLSEADITGLADYLSTLPVPDLNLTLSADAAPFNPFMARGAYSGCASCHGAAGGGNEALGAPRIAQQYPSYIKRQLLNFRAGLRGVHDEDIMGKQMRLIATQISSESDIETIVRYLKVVSVQ